MLIGFIAPIIVYPVFYMIVFLVWKIFPLKPFINLNGLILLSIAPNFLLIRQAMSRKKLEHTGGGLVALTFIYIMLFFLARNYIASIQLPGLIIPL